ncbi:2TM domain-containing protein [Sulfitobacter sp. MF3-043]|uniref:2TM domain-containing protein n=1 Tax=Sulfitobacter sediminivivens TaxID=3252902 RepID=UPI0036D876BF
MESSDEYQSAKKRVEAKMGFYTHLSVYAAVILFLAIINFVTSSGTIWFHWPMLGWGFAVAIHAALVFVFPRRFAVTEQMIEKEIGKARERS